VDDGVAQERVARRREQRRVRQVDRVAALGARPVAALAVLGVDGLPPRGIADRRGLGAPSSPRKKVMIAKTSSSSSGPPRAFAYPAIAVPGRPSRMPRARNSFEALSRNVALTSEGA
jgi:hypothetical protein